MDPFQTTLSIFRTSTGQPVIEKHYPSRDRIEITIQAQCPRGCKEGSPI